MLMHLVLPQRDAGFVRDQSGCDATDVGHLTLSYITWLLYDCSSQEKKSL